MNMLDAKNSCSEDYKSWKLWKPVLHSWVVLSKQLVQFQGQGLGPLQQLNIPIYVYLGRALSYSFFYNALQKAYAIDLLSLLKDPNVNALQVNVLFDFIENNPAISFFKMIGANETEGAIKIIESAMKVATRLFKAQQFDGALIYYKKADHLSGFFLDENASTENKTLLMLLFFGMGRTYQQLKKEVEAQESFSKALPYGIEVYGEENKHVLQIQQYLQAALSILDQCSLWP